jgi:hypothetical protein
MAYQSMPRDASGGLDMSRPHCADGDAARGTIEFQGGESFSEVDEVHIHSQIPPTGWDVSVIPPAASNKRGIL